MAADKNQVRIKQYKPFVLFIDFPMAFDTCGSVIRIHIY